MRTYINLALVMLLGGLWHGAAWNFVIWGAIHGLMLIIERLGGKHPFYERLGVRQDGDHIRHRLLRVGLLPRADLPAAVEYCRSMLGLPAPQAGADLIGGLNRSWCTRHDSRMS